MREKILRATHTGTLQIGEISIDCAVLEDGTRVLSDRGLTKALGGKRSGSHWKRVRSDPDGANLPIILSAKNLRPFIDNELAENLAAPIGCVWKGGKVAKSIQAAVLPDICNVFLKARDAEGLHPLQQDMAKRADLLMRGLAHVGIIALVDEATGYQEVRDRLALQKILEKYIAKELMPWTKRFPDEFYELMFELKGWSYKPLSIARPSVVGHYTNDLVYSRLAPGVLQKLREITPRDEKGRTRHRFHQRLTDDVGHPKLAEHLSGVMALMRAAPKKGWAQFYRMLQRAYPKLNQTIDMPLDDSDD
ncbi:MAG: P63C domain-containing protein [bacterium]|nr:P63C domain-containing protein [bacterium]